MLQVNDFLLRLSLCRGIGLVSKYRLWECAQQARCFNNIDYLIDHANVSLRSASSLKNNWTSPELDQAVALNSQEIPDHLERNVLSALGIVLSW